jgi:ATP-binding cassette, subfamily B (MDR/TAP), member 1
MKDPMLFNDTIIQNVLNGLHQSRASCLSEEEKRELVVRACKQADAHDFIIKLPLGYETNVGERSGSLSGGQRQRIAIARSIISNPKILLLDEATSALDSESERAVQVALDKASQGRTTLMIAHKLSTVERADKIVVIDKGRIVEEGTHASLLENDGAYCRLLHAQRLSIPGGTETATTTNDTDILRGEIEKQSLVKSSQIGQSTEVPISLDSKSIARKHSILHCILTIISETRNILPAFIGATIGALVAGAAIPIQAFLFSKLITVFQLQGAERIDQGNFWALMFFVLALANLISYAVLWFLFCIAGAQISRKYRSEYLRGMLAQDIGWFEVKGNTSGALTALVSTDGDDLEMLFSMSLGLIMVFAIDVFSCCILALAVGWKLGLVGVFGCYPVLFLAGYFRIRMDTGAQDRCASSFLESARFASEAVEAIRTVSSLRLESMVIERYGDRLRKAVVTSSKRMVISMVFFAMSDCMDFLGRLCNIPLRRFEAWTNLESNRIGILVWWQACLRRRNFCSAILSHIHRNHLWRSGCGVHLWL